MSSAPPQQQQQNLGLAPVSKYERDKKIGEGTYGVVFRAKDRTNGNIVALKRIRLDTEEEGVPCTAIREISLLKELRHENIVKLLDVVHSERKLTLVFEFLEMDLKAFMDEQSGNMEAGTVQHFMRDLLKGIDFCHQRNVLHRDLKPQNLLVSRTDKILKLADFGLGRAFGIPVKKYTHEVVTLWYRSPDVLLGSTQYGTAVDMWSVGCIFAEMATGQPLFAGKQDGDQLLRIFKFLGTPSSQTWPIMHRYPNSAAMLQRPEFLTNFEPENEKWFANTPGAQKLGKEGFDLLLKLLCYEPQQRITARDALAHPYFNTVLN